MTDTKESIQQKVAILELRMNAFTANAPLRFKVETNNEIKKLKEQMENFITVVDAFDSQGNLVNTSKTRKELENFLGFEVWSRNEDRRRWNQPDKSGVDSLCGIDEVSVGFDAKLRLRFRFEKA